MKLFSRYRVTPRSLLIGFAFFIIPPFLILFSFIFIDLMLHKKYEDSFGLNYRGYRGEIVKSKDDNVIRIGTFGGSTTFGYGVKEQSSWPQLLESKLNAIDARANNKFEVVNLGYNNEGAYAYSFNIKQFSYLGFDYVIFFTGVNDLGGPNYTVFRNNPIFTKFRYFPISPIIFAEKAQLLDSQGNLEDAYLGTAEPSQNPIKRFLASFLKFLVRSYESFQREKFTPNLNINLEDKPISESVSNSCSIPWIFYCNSLFSAIVAAEKSGAKVIVVSEPSRGKSLSSQKKSIMRLVSTLPGYNASLLWLDYTELLNLEDVNISFDKMHLTENGNSVLAHRMAEDTFDFLNQPLQK